MEYNLTSLQPVLPEIFLLAAACLILVIDLFLSDRTRLVTYGLSLAALIGAVALVQHAAGPEYQIILDGSFIRDPMADVLKTGLLLVTLFAFVYAKDYLREQGMMRGEYFVLGLFAALGMMVMISANSFLTVYLGLELLALCLYALVAFHRDSDKGAEAAMKYFVLGALASGMLLYGISMVYGATGQLTFPEVASVIASGKADHTVLVFGLVFIVIGVSFKFGAVPFSHVGAGRLSRCAYIGHPVSGQCAQDRGFCTRDASVGRWVGRLVEPMAGYADHSRRVVDGVGQSGGHCADQHQAHAGVLNHIARGLHFSWPACGN